MGSLSFMMSRARLVPPSSLAFHFNRRLSIYIVKLFNSMFGLATHKSMASFRVNKKWQPVCLDVTEELGSVAVPWILSE